MSRVFLFSANTTIEPYPVYPLGMAVLAGALAGRGHEVRQFDVLAAGDEVRLCREVADFAPDLVGMSLRNIDNVDSFSDESGWYLGQARHLVDQVRKACSAPLVVGGPAFSIMPEAILDYLGADCGIVGEGEEAICRLVDDLGAGREISAIIRGDGRRLVGAQMSAPLYDREWADYYLRHSGMINLQTKRGCPYACSYCTYPTLEGTRFRPRPVAAVADDLERIRRDHGPPGVFFTDSIFNDPAGHYLELAEEILRRGIDVRWCAFFRPQGLGRRELALLKRSGLYALELGTDAASDATLRGMNKGFSFAEVLELNEACLAEELPCAHFIIFGGPAETPQTVAEGLENISRLGPAVVFAFSGIRILPGAPLQQQAVAEGVIGSGESLLKPVYYYSPDIDAEAMNAAIASSFQGRRDRIFPPSEGQARLAVMRRFGFKGILWNHLISFKDARQSA